MTEHDTTPTFVRASELYCTDTGTTYPHHDEEIAAIFSESKCDPKFLDLTGGEQR